MPVAIPPRGTRVRFWLTGLRVDPLYRPWVAAQIMRDDYERKRLWATILLQTVCLIIPQTLIALADHSVARLWIPLTLAAFYLVLVAFMRVRRRPMRELARLRLLAYYGVTADGTLTEPISAWGANPLGKVGIALLSAQVLIFSSGIAVAADRIEARRACHAVSAQDTAALTALFGVPSPLPAGSFGTASPIVAVGAPLIAAREVDTGITGLHLIAAYTRDFAGQRIGPAVWQIAEPFSSLNPLDAINISAEDSLARRITPSTGYGTSDHEPPIHARARECAKAAA